MEAFTTEEYCFKCMCSIFCCGCLDRDKDNDIIVIVIVGDLHNHQQLVNAIKQVDIVISAVGGDLVAHQVKIIAAIKEAGNIKRFLPSEFGVDMDRVHAIEPAASLCRTKVEIRRAIEAEGIPYTYLVSNGFAGYLNYILNNFGDSSSASPPKDKIVILGDANPKGVRKELEEDIAAYTIKAADDLRTLNKSVYVTPPTNTLSYNETVSLWEKKIGKTVEKIYVPGDEVLKKIQEASMPLKLLLSLAYTFFVKGEIANFEIKASFGMEATELYPDVKYTTLDEYLSQFVSN
ncbi:phenylcoumaran benzylic ether reductase Pyrc5-like [Coffea arabica]|uniref:Phenylcoumaran benzylic ether reductase Pyrc5-like n=1 Tax=Coffea arabica TaxID=13443 RepID=A0A6P6V8Z3_COFAR|nr:isoflavone reductase homolog PCBER-like [Coffea arabica]